MAKTIVGLYDDHDRAKEVVEALGKADVDRDDIHTHFHRGTTSGFFSGGGDIADELSRRGVPEDEAMLYAEGVRRGGNLVFLRVADERAQAAAQVMQRYTPVDIEERHQAWKKRGYTGYDRTAKRMSDEEARADRAETIKIVEEELRVGKREVEGGAVRVHSYVETEPVEEKVRLHEEHVEVERRDVDRPVKAAKADELFEEKTIEMHERSEELVVDKEAKVTGEVVVKKEGHDRTETVRDTVRRTEVEVERTDGERTRASAARFDDHADAYRTHYKTAFAGSGRDFSAYEPAYRFGHTYGTDGRFRDHDYAKAEPQLRRDYEAEHGEGTFEQVKDAIRHAYDRVRTSDRAPRSERTRTAGGTQTATHGTAH